MKIFVMAALSVMLVSSVASAQCGCGAPVVYQPAVRVAPMPMAASMPLPAPVVSRAPATVAFVNQLENPIQRQNYTLNYAIHLTDGRVLLSDVLRRVTRQVALSLVDTTAAG